MLLQLVLLLRNALGNMLIFQEHFTIIAYGARVNYWQLQNKKRKTQHISSTRNRKKLCYYVVGGTKI